jgi:Prealbumin-like fold domain
LQFGEAAIDLTAAGLVPPGICEAFGSAFLKSRASASFTAEVKDFIAPIPVNISNCGEVRIIKQTDPRGQAQNFSYTSNLPAEAPGTVNGVPQGGVACPGQQQRGCPGVKFCITDPSGNPLPGSPFTTDSNGAVCGDGLTAFGNYTVQEVSPPTGYAIDDSTATR